MSKKSDFQSALDQLYAAVTGGSVNPQECDRLLEMRDDDGIISLSAPALEHLPDGRYRFAGTSVTILADGDLAVTMAHVHDAFTTPVSRPPRPGVHVKAHRPPSDLHIRQFVAPYEKAKR